MIIIIMFTHIKSRMLSPNKKNRLLDPLIRIIRSLGWEALAAFIDHGAANHHHFLQKPRLPLLMGTSTTWNCWVLAPNLRGLRSCKALAWKLRISSTKFNKAILERKTKIATQRPKTEDLTRRNGFLCPMWWFSIDLRNWWLTTTTSTGIDISCRKSFLSGTWRFYMILSIKTATSPAMLTPLSSRLTGHCHRQWINVPSANQTWCAGKHPFSLMILDLKLSLTSID